ncbi:hypothetical protein [Roseococcus pinisoli]|uniref:Uncharacterized protein n=1 Tax=Roseococcus pinisoli TaxID=2835040 RepID=A0ABS5QBJ8_9PROT|nr:hypothetical protein [Roseococcus pinisoli]MBS7811066.1 hypothetical protein [Roseococcus pinisoli]
MWPAFLAALLLSLPPAPANGRDAGSRSAVDRAHLGEDAPQSQERVAKEVAREEDEDESDGDTE